MLRYTNKDYKIEMIGYRGKLPRGWIKKYISDEHSKKSDEKKQEIHEALLNTLAGNNHKKGISGGYVNVIRKVYSEFNNKEYVELPKEVVVY